MNMLAHALTAVAAALDHFWAWLGLAPFFAFPGVVIYNTTLKNTRLTDVVTAIDTGGAGSLNIYTTGLGTLLASITLANPVGTVTGGVLSFSGLPLTESSANATGTAAAAEIFSGAGTLIVSGLTVGTSGTDIVLSSTAIVAGQPVTITAASITHG